MILTSNNHKPAAGGTMGLFTVHVPIYLCAGRRSRVQEGHASGRRGHEVCAFHGDSSNLTAGPSPPISSTWTSCLLYTRRFIFSSLSQGLKHLQLATRQPNTKTKSSFFSRDSLQVHLLWWKFSYVSLVIYSCLDRCSWRLNWPIVRTMLRYG